MRRLLGCFLAASLSAFALPALADAPPPIGYWSTDDGSEKFLIQENGQCSFQGPNGYMVGGPCSWNASSTGGILTIVNSNQYQPAPIYYNVIWVDQRTITIEGDVFHRAD